MPRTTRRGMAAAAVGPAEVTGVPSKPAKSNDSQEDKENDGPRASKSKRRATARSSTKKTSSTSGNAAPWDVEGHYQVTDVTDERPIDTTAFSLKVFYYNLSLPRQLYVNFVFDKLEGMMRLCPYEQLEKVGEKKFVLAEFEKACKLETSSEPGPTNAKWIMRWRGKDGGIRQDKKVGGELEANFSFDFEKDASSSSADFQGMNIKFVFVHEEHMFIFKASKIANLDRECTDAPWVVERKWSDLYDFRWSHDSDSDSDSTSTSNLDSTSDSDSESASEPGSVKDAFVSLFTTNLNPLLQAAYGASPEAGEAVVNCILNQLAPYRGLLGQEVTVTKSQKRSEKPVAFDAENRAKDLGQIVKVNNKPTRKTGSVPSPLLSYLEKPPAWAWDVTGHWTVTSPMLAAVLGGQDMQSMSIQIMLANNPRHNKIGRQLWATFKFGGKLEGCMRFVPHVEEGARYWQLKDFEKACPLKDGSWPGPAPNGQQEWLLRWRGMNPKTHEMSPCCDSYQTVVSFEMNEQDQLAMKGVMTCNFQPTTFYATKVGEWVPSGGRDPTVATTWASY